MKLCNTLAQHRTAAGMTQAELAVLTGVSRKTINTVENRVFTPSTILALKIALVLGVTVHDIFQLPDTQIERDVK